MSDQPPSFQVPAALADLYLRVSNLISTILDLSDRVSALELENGMEEDLPSQAEAHQNFPRKGHSTQVLLGTSKAARKAYQQAKDP